MAAVFVDLSKNKCNFLHKNKPDVGRRVQFIAGNEEFFCRGSRRHCPMEVGARVINARLV